jgi:hypothetical protein
LVVLRQRGRDTQDVAATRAHVGFGAAAGAIFANLERGPKPVLPFLPAGMLFGAAVWLVSYQGWIPAAGIMPPASRDRPGRPQSMLAAHLVFGAVLGGLVGAVARSEGAGTQAVGKRR